MGKRTYMALAFLVLVIGLVIAIYSMTTTPIESGQVFSAEGWVSG